MAARYWTGAVNGGTGTWDTTSTTNWSTTSGGAGGASAPTSADDAVFDASSGTGVVTLGANVTARTLVMTNYGAGTLAFGTNSISLAATGIVVYNGGTGYSVTGTPVINLTYAGAGADRAIIAGAVTEANSISFNITGGTDGLNVGGSVRSVDFTGFAGTLRNDPRTLYGSLTLSSGMSLDAGGNTMTMAGTSGTKTITFAGKTLDTPLTFNGAGSTWRLQDTAIVGTTRNTQLTAGTLDINGQSFTTGTMGSANSNVRGLLFGTNGTINIMGSGASACNFATVTNFTVTGTGTINLASASAKTFAGGGAKVWPFSLNQGGAGTLTITGQGTFADISNTVNGTTVILPASATTNVVALSLHGVSGSLTTLQSSSSGTPATLRKTSGSITTSYLSIKDITATGGAVFRAPINLGNVDAGGNSGWNFGVTGGAGAAGLKMSLGLSL